MKGLQYLEGQAGVEAAEEKTSGKEAGEELKAELEKFACGSARATEARIGLREPEESAMTCCVAALCDEARSIVLVSDKMIGMGMIESEPEINKVLYLHKKWRVMFAGNEIAPAFPVVEATKRKLAQLRRAPTLKEVMNAVYTNYNAERTRQSEGIYRAPRGWTLKDFNSPKASAIPEATREEIDAKIAGHRVEVSLIVAGFDNRAKGHIFSFDDYEERGKPRVQDLPGFDSIGSGSEAAMYMMAYREVSSSMPLRLALYYAIEGKYFGERAAGVGTKTDVLVIRSDKPSFKINEKVLEDKFFKLCARLQPREMRKSHIDVLNSLGGKHFDSTEKLEIEKENGDWIIRAKGKPAAFSPSASRKSGAKP